MPTHPAAEILDEIRRGRMVVLMDDEDRENEGDLVMAASAVRAEDVNFMARFGRGLICLTVTGDRCRQLQLPLMVPDTHYRGATNFTVSIEAARGVTTGISAADRAATIQAAVAKDASPADIVMPGHIFPLLAQQGGVLARAGHTEAAVDLARLAGLEPAGVICEIMNEDGSMARRPELEVFAKAHGLKIGTIADLIRYRLEHESTVHRIGESVLPTAHGEFRVVAYHDDVGGSDHLALIRGSGNTGEPVLVRVHVHKSLLDLVTDAHRTSAWSLDRALERVAREGGVVVIVNAPEGREGLGQRLASQRGAREGSPPRTALRTFGLGSQILADLGVRRITVLGHSARTPAISGFGIEIAGYVEDEPGGH